MTANQRYSVLLVDDEPSVRESMAMVLKYAGYEVSTAFHGLDALAQLEARMPDAIISDLNMPEMSGFEFLSAARLRFPAIPLIAMSGACGSSGRMPEGVIADDSYAKGQDRPEKLLRSVRDLIHGSLARAIIDEVGPSSATGFALVAGQLAC